MLYTSENLGGTLLTTLGGNQDDTVGTAGSVEGCGRRILEDRETLDVIGAQTVKVCCGQLDVVDQDKRVGATLAERGDATNEEVGVVLARLTRAGVGYHTSDVTGKRLGKAARWYAQVLGVDRGNRRGDTLLLLLTVGYDRYLVKLVALGGKLYIDNCLVSHGNDFVLHTYVGEHKFVGWLDFDLMSFDLNIDVDPSLTDVNVHPSKMDIKFSNFDDLKNLVFEKIKEALNSHFLAPTVDNSSVKVDNIVETINVNEEEKKEVKEYVLDFSSNDNIIKEEENDYNYQPTETKEEQKREFPLMEPVGQVLGVYIVCHSEKGMYLMDQHAAAERINYEKYKKAMANPTKDTISMLFPINLEYPKEEFLIIKEHMDFIKSLGIDIEEFGMNSFIVKAHPTWFKEGLEEVFIRNCLEKIITMNKNFDLERFNDSISAMMACKASIKAGDPISMEEMKTLIERLKKCENPFNCAHGRPTIIHYPKYELDKLFKRAV